MNYTVTYAELPSGDSGKEIVIAPRTNATLTGLKKYTSYSITVFASTAKGGGNKSEPIIVITDEDRKYNSGITQSVGYEMGKKFILKRKTWFSLTLNFSIRT